MFSRVVPYGERYQSLREVFMDSKGHEAAAIVQFMPHASYESFTISPYCIDGMIHLAGFAINAHPSTRDDLVYISTGWDDLCVSVSLSSDISYISYVNMQHSSRGLLTGDVYLLDGNGIVAMCAGLRFQEVKASSLHVLLRSTAKTSDPSGYVPGPSSASKEADLQERRSFRQHRRRGSSTPLSSTSGTSTDIQSIIALETGMDPSEIPDDVRFEKLGIDSILRVPIISKIQTETDISLSPSIFDDYPTLSALRPYIQNAVRPATSSNSTNEHPSSVALTSGISGTSTPATSHSDAFETLVEIITREAGINIRGLDASTKSSSMGVDQKKIPRVVDTLKSYTGIELSSSFFTEHSTVISALQALEAHETMPTSRLEAPSKIPDPQKDFCSRSILLSGSHLPGSPILFLMPDGAGSPPSYTDLPALPHGIAIYGLESPFFHEPL